MLTAIFFAVMAMNNPLHAQVAKPSSNKKDSLQSIPIATDTTSGAKPKSKSNGLDAPIFYSANDSIVLTLGDAKATLYQKATVDMQSMSLKARYIKVSLNNKTIFARGGLDTSGKFSDLPIYKDGPDQYTADSMLYSTQTKKGLVFGLSLTQDEAHIQLKRVLKQADGSFMGEHGKLSTCSDPHPHFYLNTSKIKIIPNKSVFFGPANLVFADIPTPLALPFGIAPLQKGRRNGIIMPNPGFNNSNNSFYLSNLGYYQGLGKYADAQMNSDVYFNGDFRIGLQTQLVRRYKYSGSLAVNMSRFGNGLDRANPLFSKSNDFSITSRFGFDQKLIPGVTLNGNINIVTGNFNKRNSRDIQNLNRSEFISSIYYGRNFFQNKVNLAASARHTQNIQTHDFKLDLPNINLGVSSLTPFAKKSGTNTKWFEQLRLSYNMNFTNSLTTKDTLIFSEKYRDVLKTIQSGFRHSIPISTNVKLFKGALNLTPSLAYQESWTFNAQIKNYNTTTKKIDTKDSSGFYRVNNYSISTGINTNIYGTFTNLKFGKVRSIRHTITPSVGFNYRPEIDAVKKGWNRSYIDSFGKAYNYSIFNSASGLSGIGQKKGGSINFGLSNNLQAKRLISKDSTGKEKLEKINLIDQLTINTNYDLTADSLNWSDLTIGINTVLMKQIRFGINTGYSPYSMVNGRRIKEFSAAQGGPWLRYKGIDFSLNSRLTPSMFGGKKSSENTPTKLTNPLKTDEAELKQVQSQPWNYYDFSIPWSMNITYNIGYNNEIVKSSNRLTNNRLSINGDISITKEWKIAYSTGYDLKRKIMAGSEFSVVRNLHCWQLEFKWIPSGYGKQWMFTLRPKSSILQDLKLNKRVFSNPVLVQ